MNSINITGNLTADCEKVSVGDSFVIKFSIANNDESRKKEDGTYENIASFFSCELWSKSCKMAKHLLKGKAVTISGSLKQYRWATEDGTNRSAVKIKCFKVEPHIFERSDTTGNNPNQNHNFDTSNDPF